MRLRTTSQHEAGWRRVRCGRGFRYLDAAGQPLEPAQVDRVRALVIPPAWTDVWVCPHERGHLQAAGTDEAGRRQYLYHPVWREQRDLAKFERVITMARKLPRVRARMLKDIVQAEDPVRRTVATGVRLVDLGCFRPGSDTYAEENGSRGLTTLECRHVQRERDAFVFAFTGKSGVAQDVRIDEPEICRAVAGLIRRRSPGSRFLAVRDGSGWQPVGPDLLNSYIRELFGMDVSAKDFRTWHATVTAAVCLAGADIPASRSSRRRQVNAAVGEAAALLGNTPSVARSSYVHPRVLDLYESGTVLARVPRTQSEADRAVVRLLS